MINIFVSSPVNNELIIKGVLSDFNKVSMYSLTWSWRINGKVDASMTDSAGWFFEKVNVILQ